MKLLNTVLKKERFNFLSHLSGMVLWIPLTLALVVMSFARLDLVVVSAIYGISTLFLFFSSALYHKYKAAEDEISLRRVLDHFAIFVMIAGSYTPIVWIWFDEPWKTGTLVFQWSLTLVGLLLKLFKKKPNRILETVLYVAMGWLALYAMVPLYERMPLPIFLNLMGGGVFYTLGAVIYALKKPNLTFGSGSRSWVLGFHEIFHLFILGGAIFHFGMVWGSVAGDL